MTTTEKRGLHAKLAEVMAEAGRIPKRGKAPQAMGGFEFVQVGDAADAIRTALGERKVSMLPSTVEVVAESEHATRSGGTMTTLTVRTTWTLVDGETGETATIQSLGTGADSGDKYSPKAQTNAMKYALLMGFLLSTGDDPELSNSEDRRARKSSPETEVLTAGYVAPPAEKSDDGGLIGIAEVGTAKDSDFELRETPDGWALGFRLKANGRGGIKVIARDALAQALATMKRDVVDVRVTCYGHIRDETFRPKNSKRDVVYQVLDLERIRTPDWELPAPMTDEQVRRHIGLDEPLPIAPGQETLPLTDDEKAAIAGDLG